MFLPTLVSTTQNIFNADGTLVDAAMPYGQGLVEGFIKWDIPGECGYCVANEFICSELARLLRLPVPPATIAFLDGNTRNPVFFAIDVNDTRKKFPPVIPDIVAKHLPDLTTGLVLFDIWVANPDRHEENLAVNSTSDPKELVAYDHGQALFGSDRDEAADRFADLTGKLGLTDEPWGQNCLIQHLDSYKRLASWFERFERIDDWLIADILDVGCSMTSIPDNERDLAEKFLRERRRHIRELVHVNREQFVSIADWPKERQRRLM